MAPELLAWWARDEHRRDLPWRHTRDPWAVLVAEVMSQQTQVERVVPRWHSFLAQWPTPTTCAAAGAAAVVRHWVGLGYNRRAVSLWRAADATVRHHGGSLPGDMASLLALPGIGPYTARAVLAFAFEADVGVLDTNVGRILARHGGCRLSAAAAQQRADALVPVGEGWAWNQALLDLGATQCTARRPRCGTCPLRHTCRWHANGNVAPDPAAGSAAVSGVQSIFTGSDRQGRGRLVAALGAGAVHADGATLAVVMGWPDDPARAMAVAATVVRDGLAEHAHGTLRLPGQLTP